MANGNDPNATRHLLVELKHSERIAASAMTVDGFEAPPLAPDVLADVPALHVDREFGAVEIPHLTRGNGIPTDPFDLSRGFSVSEEHATNTFLVRATCEDGDLEAVVEQVKSYAGVREVYADSVIEVCDPNLEAESERLIAATPQVCPGVPPLGDDRHVAARIGVPWLRQRRMDGSGVFLAVVDTGINVPYLRSRGRQPILDVSRSWMARPSDLPGQLPVGHGTMVAYDATIAAPKATLLDIALLRSTRTGGSAMAGLLSDAIRAFVHLYRVIRGPHRPGAQTSLVVNNSWGIFHETWDFPQGHPGRYLDNPAHPFNRIVGVLAHAGADILFAAGNCGRECPDGRCQGATRAGILGANSHPQVTCVAGVDLLKRRVGYSTSGPGKLMFMKPDLCGYTHFRGSGVYPADGGTSAATPVVAGLVAAFRSRFAYNPSDYRTSPAAMRNLLTRTAEDRGAIGFDFDYGWGIANGRRLALIRSLSVTQAEEEPAASIDEFEDVEALLDRIEGIEEISEPEELVAAVERQAPWEIEPVLEFEQQQEKETLATKRVIEKEPVRVTATLSQMTTKAKEEAEKPA